MKRLYRKKKKGPVQAKKIKYDGINFASGLERYMYMALKKAKIKAKYEGETFVLLNGFHFENEVYERQSNGKGDYKNRGCKRILPIKYTPDFIGDNFIIETKGRFTVADRRKHLCIKKQHPKLDIRFVFTNSKNKIRKNSKTSYANWCIKYGFLYCDRIIPEEWLKERGRIKHDKFIKFKNSKIRR